jgi:hypothetical protein
MRKIGEELFSFQKLVKMWLFEVISPIYYCYSHNCFFVNCNEHFFSNVTF